MLMGAQKKSLLIEYEPSVEKGFRREHNMETSSEIYFCPIQLYDGVMYLWICNAYTYMYMYWVLYKNNLISNWKRNWSKLNLLFIIISYLNCMVL